MPTQPHKTDTPAPTRRTARPESPSIGRKASEEDSDVEDGDWVPKLRAKKRKKPSGKNVTRASQKTPMEFWEDDVERVDIITKDPETGELSGWLVWKTTDKVSSHPLHLLYSRCPQKTLEYYENQLVFEQGQTANSSHI